MGRSFATHSGFQGDALVQILDFPIHSILYIFTSPSAQAREKSASLGRPILQNRPLG